jgi:hypothetical protein
MQHGERKKHSDDCRKPASTSSGAQKSPQGTLIGG